MMIVEGRSEALVSAERSEIEADIMFPEDSLCFECSGERIDHSVFRKATDCSEVVDSIGETVIAAGQCSKVSQLSVTPPERVKVKAEGKIEAAIWIGIGGACAARDLSVFVDYDRETVHLAVGAAECAHINQLVTMVISRASLSRHRGL